IDPLIYEIITTHYQELELLRRFKENSSNTIIELTNSIHIALNNGSSLQQIKQNTLQTCQLNKNHKGFNHYQIILEETLIQSNSFLSLF
ncbi:hypothetical protein ACH8I4_17155, partial [Acinetobacter sp. ABJ_C3_5]|uniref:hypothetical protein n=1 Tax=Acinetobacter courvalinii TaxID=280147 RepID=UPI0037C8A5C1